MTDPGRIRILIADDHEIVRKGLELVFQMEEDFQVVAAVASGAEALRQAVRLQPDVVLLDLVMPDADGVAVTGLIKRGAPGVRVLLITGHGTFDRVLDALLAGADGYLVKDVGPQELFRAVRTVAQGEAYLQPQVTRHLLRLLTPEAHPRSTGRGGDLTPRELDILRIMAAGATTQEIADRLSIGVETARTHIKNILQKLGTQNRTQAVLVALRRGLVKL